MEDLVARLVQTERNLNAWRNTLSQIFDTVVKIPMTKEILEELKHNDPENHLGFIRIQAKLEVLESFEKTLAYEDAKEALKKKGK